MKKLLILFALYICICGCSNKQTAEDLYDYGLNLQLQGNLRDAMDCYNRAFDACSVAKDVHTAGLVRYRQSELYESIFYDWDDCIGWLEEAKDCFETSADTEYRLLCEIKIAAIMLAHGEYASGAKQVERICEEDLQKCSDEIVSKYHFVKLFSIIYTTQDEDMLRSALGEYLDLQVSDEGIWDILKCEMLYKLLETTDIDGTLLASIHDYQRRTYEMMSAAISQEIQFSDDNWQIFKHKKKAFLILLAAIVLLAAVIITLLLVNYITTKKNIALTQNLEASRIRLEAALSNVSNSNEHMSEYLKDRLDTVNMLIRYCLTNSVASYRKLEARIKEHDLTKENILVKNAEVFYDIYPKFTKVLQDKGLTEQEIHTAVYMPSG